MVRFLKFCAFSLTIFQVFLAIKAQTCSTGCAPIVNAGPSQAIFSPGQLCLVTGTTNGCSYTNATCTGFSTSTATSLSVQLLSTLAITPIGNGVFGAGSSTGNFECGSDGNWYLTGFLVASTALTTNLFCDTGCTPFPCPAVSACSTPSTTSSPSTKSTSSPSTKFTSSPSTKSSGCSARGTWSPWTTSKTCTKTSGSCGTTTKTRSCLSASIGCRCIGKSSITTYCKLADDTIKGDSTTKTIVCNYTPCFFPRSSCCTGFKSTIINGTVICGPLPTVPIDTPSTCTTSSPPTACPPGGTWSAWSAGTCSDTCGMCGTLTTTRTCLSAASGCPCSGSSVNNTPQRCGSKTCTFPRLTCCSGATTGVVNSTFACVVSG